MATPVTFENLIPCSRVQRKHRILEGSLREARMGMYLIPGAEMLRQGRRSRVYVDKSMLIGYLNEMVATEQKYVCMSRPSRFGKSMAANMVCAYYDRTVYGAAEFAGLEIADDPSFDRERSGYDVIRVNMQEFLSATHDVGICSIAAPHRNLQ